MAITKVSFLLSGNQRLEVSYPDDSGSLLPVAVTYTQSTDSIDVTSTGLLPTMIASVNRLAIVHWTTDLAAVTNA